LHGNYEGIGAELGIKDGHLIVVSPIDGGPAKAAGIKAGDKILSIDGVSTVGLGVTEAVSKIRGPAATTITLSVQSADDKPRDLALTRAVITLPSISWQDKGDGIAYLRISRFYGSEGNKEWDDVISDMNIKMKELDALIVDLRDNPGGYMQTSVYMAEEFFSNKPVLYQESATGEQIEFKAKRVGAFHNVPAVFVLINGGSASASEILAAALRDNIGAKLIGVKSFGKGTIQTAQDFEDGSGIHVTIAKWLTPKKEWVGNGSNKAVGLTPDVEVQMTDQDRTDNRDPQLDKAIEMAKKI
jgi:carboxyl-terminal processing protease